MLSDKELSMSDARVHLWNVNTGSTNENDPQRTNEMMMTDYDKLNDNALPSSQVEFGIKRNGTEKKSR